MPDSPQPESPGFHLSLDQDARRLSLAGRLGIAEAGRAETELAAALGSVAGALEIDLSGLERLDTVGAWLIHRTLRDRPGSELVAPSPQAKLLIAEVAAADRPLAQAEPPLPFVVRELDRLGLYIITFCQTLIAGLGFIGLTIVSAWQAAKSGRGVRWRAVTVQMEQVGVNALGIVGLMSFLIGIVLAQQGAVQLRQFGAEVFVINLVGRATFRELGILLTAIMVAGRSASAFAAQIGSMKLAEEVDAMRTIGLDPVEMLVLPRVIALVLMMPLLAFYASILAIVGGGLFAWADLGIPPATFAQRLREVVPMSDFWIGLSKAPVFGAIIAIIGCHQGFMVSGNAESVGQRTTLAVVQAIFIVIVLDAVFAVFYTALGFN
ncbi:MlaE family lipid ABC transporter permease subunit [Sandaracinobacter sp. RS1-74]|uniref:ABC transporter permease n=1 Tax=Sandaracinobacteroides sayramensis TaxID=2913411 RepID=UPI001EDC3ABA|nr:MlaE family lipid ABC transporter permease subunit [Sandaracinobacteroides sayramensis]MCG2840834.1 MlaE family lipid ABC transporter permease subunit [Sandaracinobacteroides sayramensis]